jgi:hypothetical protein
MKHILAGAIGALAMGGCVSADGVETPPQVEPAGAASTNLVIIYGLKDGVSPADFEAWVRETDYPSLRGLTRVRAFRTHRAERLLAGTGAGEPSIEYIETFSIPDLDGFVSGDMGGGTVQTIMGQFMGFAEAPEFIVVEEIN